MYRGLGLEEGREIGYYKVLFILLDIDWLKYSKYVELCLFILCLLDIFLFVYMYDGILN